MIKIRITIKEIAEKIDWPESIKRFQTLVTKWMMVQSMTMYKKEW